MGRAAVPGRVNLIGDHIDYCGLPVLPFAIQRRVNLWFRAADTRRVRVFTTADGSSREFALADPLEPWASGDWGNYVKAAVAELQRDGGRLFGFDAVLDSDLPASAGLSSSSAIVVATALAFLAANGLPIDRLRLADRLARAERYTGTAGGGMDQAILLLAREGRASRIGFHPLSADAVRLPRDWAFVVAHSLIEADKTGAARGTYNTRPRQAEQARAAVAGRLGIPNADYPDLRSRYDTDALLAAAADVDPILRDRFTHVVTEADRVDRAVAALEGNDAPAFGALMTESHRSLRDLCQVSHPRLDELVHRCTEAGALGARMTGAGFGGCVVALMTRDDRQDLLDALRVRYYEPHGASGSELRQRLFPVHAAAGATVDA